MKEVVDKAITDADGTEVLRFDYTSLEPNVGIFLKEKASRIVDFSIKSVMAIGKELKAAQEKLASHDKTKGVFIKWVQSLGLSDDTAYNYIHTYTFVSERFGNIESAKDFLMLPQKLQYEVSKPSAPAELVDNVLSGDITTHKKYKELEAKLDRAENEKRENDIALTKAQGDVKTLQGELKKVQKELKDAKITGNSEEIKHLQSTVYDKVDKLGEAQKKIESLEKQLKDKPIEVPAVKEVIPDEVRLAIYEKVARLYEGINRLTDLEIRIFAEDIQDDDREEISDYLNRAGGRLESIAYDVANPAEE